jgi:hypothetical protein
LTVVQLATVPVAGGASITIRGSGFHSGIKVTIGGKATAATFIDMNTVAATSPALSAGAHRLF